LLLPPSLKDWLPEGHLAYFIEDIVNNLDLSDIYDDYDSATGSGAPPFSPILLPDVLLYSYATGTFSSRKIAQRCIEDVGCRYLAAQETPNFRTFIKFRSRHIERFHSIFIEVLKVAKESGLIKLGHVSVDGSKFKANASKHKAMSYSHMLKSEEKLNKEIQELLDHAQEVDAAEDEQYGDYDGYSLPDHLAHKEGRLKAIKDAMERLEKRAKEAAEKEVKRRAEEAESRKKSGKKPKRYRKPPDPVPKPKQQESFTDTDSRIMRDGATKGFIQAYNCEFAIDDTQKIIIANEVVNNAGDSTFLIPILDQVKETFGTFPKKVTADGGYKSETNFEALLHRKIDAFIACGKEVYDPSKVAPKGRIPSSATNTERMERKLLTKAGRKLYKKRKVTAEPPFAWIKNVLGFRQFSLRGLNKVKGEFDLVCLALNLRRMAKMNVTG
jgi:transposase